MTNGVIDLETEEPQQVDVERPAPAPGAQLAAQREALNWSIDQVANQLNLAPRQIQAIEAGNYAVLPGIAIVRGFIRSYAKLLKMDAAPLLLHIQDKTTVANDVMPMRRALPKVSFSDSRLPSNRYRFVSKSTILVLLCIGVVMATLVGQQMKWVSILPESLALKLDRGLAFLSASVQNISAHRVAATVPADMPTVTDNASEVMAAASIVAPTEISNTAIIDSNVMAIDSVAADKVASTASPRLTMSLSNPAATASASDTKDMLVLKLREDSWVEIKRPDHTTLISRLVKAGSTETFNIAGPVSLTVGNASGVDAILRGEPLTLLESGTKSNVARLTLK